MPVHKTLQAFIAKFDGVPVEWGVSDCTAFAADWARINGHALNLPAYVSREEAYRLIAAAGTLANLWDDRLADVGVFETGMPVIGDVGIIDTVSFGQVGGIFAEGGAFLWRTTGGVTFLYPRRFVRAWSLKCAD